MLSWPIRSPDRKLRCNRLVTHTSRHQTRRSGGRRKGVLEIRRFGRRDDHDWSQRHLSHYVEGDLAARAHRRLERHAAECPECSRGLRAMKALLRLIPGIGGEREISAPDSVFDRVRADASAPTSKPERGKEKR